MNSKEQLNNKDQKIVEKDIINSFIAFRNEVRVSEADDDIINLSEEEHSKLFYPEHYETIQEKKLDFLKDFILEKMIEEKEKKK